jgi:hypothetical protein
VVGTCSDTQADVIAVARKDTYCLEQHITSIAGMVGILTLILSVGDAWLRIKFTASSGDLKRDLRRELKFLRWHRNCIKLALNGTGRNVMNLH